MQPRPGSRARVRFTAGALACALTAAGCGNVTPIEELDAASDAPPPTPAMLAITPGAHGFGEVVVGAESAPAQIMVRNDGGGRSGPIDLALVGSAPGAFRIVPTGDARDCLRARLEAGESCTAQVVFAPTAAGGAGARLEIVAEPGGLVGVDLTGDGVSGAQLTTAQTAHDFGDVVTGQASSVLAVVVRNSGEQTAGALTVALAGAHPGDFEIVPTGTAGDCAGRTLAVQATCTAQVRFRPTQAALRTAELTLSADPGGSVTVPLTGDGLSPGALALELPTGGSIDFGTRELGSASPAATIRVRNTGGAPTGPLAVALGGGAGSYTITAQTCDGAALGAGMTCEVALRFAPAAVGAVPATISIRDTVAMTGASVAATGTGSARLTVAKTGSGTIASAPAGLSCGPACSAQTAPFTQTPVALTATADAGWVFTAWTGACASANPAPVCSVALAQAQTSVGATFTQVFTLDVTTTGAGTVTSTAPGIACGNGNGDCAEVYPIGTMVELTADPDAGWEVFSWTGAGASCTGSARTCTVTMTQARTVGVTFRRQYTLTVAKSGQGVGTVTSSAGGIGCGPACATQSATFWEGDAVTLTQAAGTDSAFVQWAGACTGSGACALTMSADRTVTAEFKRQYLVTLSVAGPGAGSLTVQPGNFTCTSGTCTRLFDGGTNLTVTATPASAVDGLGAITGACTATPCTLSNLSGPRAVSASFVRYQCAPSTQTCTAGNFTQCDATGNFVSYAVPNGGTDGSPITLTMNNYSCPMGCHASEPRCADVDASNGLNAALDAPQTSPAGRDLVLPVSASAPAGVVVIDTNNYDAGTGETTITDADGSLLRVPAQVVVQTGGPEILVLKVRSFTVRAGRTVTVRGTRALAVASHFDIYVAGVLDLAAVMPSPDASISGPGGSTRTACQGGTDGNGAFGGGGNVTSGGVGSAGSGGSAGGSPTHNSSLTPLEGGCSGGVLYNGGGAIQLVSRRRVALASTAVLDVSGGGGATIFFGSWFPTGGGAGGAVSIEAPVTQLASGSIVAGRGGSGAATNSGQIRVPGNKGPVTGTAPAAPVTCAGCGTSGTGGTELANPISASGMGAAKASGGGSVGRCVVRNATGVLAAPAGTMKLHFAAPLTLGARHP